MRKIYHDKPCCDHLGEKYYSITAMCQHWESSVKYICIAYLTDGR